MPNQYDLTGSSSVQLSPHMRRIKFKGDDLSLFPRKKASNYLRLSFEDDDAREVKRVCAIRAVDGEALTLALVDYQPVGPAFRQARGGRVGSILKAPGPRDEMVANSWADCFFPAET